VPPNNAIAPELLILVRLSVWSVIVGGCAHNVGFYTRNPVNSGVILLNYYSCN
jgi:hypothetical protein